MNNEYLRGVAVINGTQSKNLVCALYDKLSDIGLQTISFVLCIHLLGEGSFGRHLIRKTYPFRTRYVNEIDKTPRLATTQTQMLSLFPSSSAISWKFIPNTEAVSESGMKKKARVDKPVLRLASAIALWLSSASALFVMNAILASNSLIKSSEERSSASRFICICTFERSNCDDPVAGDALAQGLGQERSSFDRVRAMSRSSCRLCRFKQLRLLSKLSRITVLGTWFLSSLACALSCSS